MTLITPPDAAAAALGPSVVHFIGGEKGGVGKSLVSRLIAQQLIDRGIAFTGFDTDRSHGALMRFYADYASPALVDSLEALDAIMERAVEHPGQRVLVDLAAHTHDALAAWMDESGVLELAHETGVTVNYWHVMDAGRDSVDLLAHLLDRFGDRLANWRVHWAWVHGWSSSNMFKTPCCAKSMRPTAASGQPGICPATKAPNSASIT